MKMLIVNNPNAGKKTVQKHLNTLVGRLVIEGIVSCVKSIDEGADGRERAFVEAAASKDIGLVMVIGGDGTIHEVVNIMIKNKIRIPIALIPAGTVNDFANYLYLPKDIDDVFEMVKRFKLQAVDVGKVNNRYFINVAFAGMMAKVGYETPGEIKTVFGRLAYYAAGIREVSDGIGRPYTFRFQYDGNLLEIKSYLFAVMNSSSTGGFMNFAPYAEVNDGLLDVIAIKKSDMIDMAAVFLKLISGQHIKDPNVIYFKTDKLKVETESPGLIVDIDGEKGVEFPLEFSIIRSALEFLVP
ncbi:MAG: diacylglycerol kinase family lipid kinase [Peptostreptococcaceae bacterium]|nr:diacylglycerol kinase family lipid kinase [Peptostreptococcaceae bacterium]